MEVKNLDLDDKQLQLLKNILKEKVDSKTVWAYGSRIDGTSDKKSDLDLDDQIIFAVLLHTSMRFLYEPGYTCSSFLYFSQLFSSQNYLLFALLGNPTFSS